MEGRQISASQTQLSKGPTTSTGMKCHFGGYWINCKMYQPKSPLISFDLDENFLLEYKQQYKSVVILLFVPEVAFV